MPVASDHVNKIMDQPEAISKAAQKPLEKIKTLFKLDVVEFKKEKNTGDKFFGSTGKRFADKNDPEAPNFVKMFSLRSKKIIIHYIFH